MGNKSSHRHASSPDANPYPKHVPSNAYGAPSAPNFAPPSYAEAVAPDYGHKAVVEAPIQATVHQTYQSAYPTPAGYHQSAGYHQPAGSHQSAVYPGHPAAAPLPQGPILGAQTTYVIPKGFDSGARFDGIARPNIPPPPPGCAPNAAQLAVAQGHNVVIGQKENNFIKGGSDGGYTFW